MTTDEAAPTLAQRAERLTAQVKAAPGNAALRVSLAEVLAAAGNLERADAQLDIAATQDPSWAVKTALLRQLLRAEKTRREVFEAKALPELLLEPTAAIEQALKLTVDCALAPDQAVDLQSNESLPTAQLDDGPRLHPFIDLDDRTRGVAELMSSTGKYFWVPLEAIESAEFSPAQTLFEQLWRPCSVAVRGGPSGLVYWPAIYPPRSDDSDAERQGLVTQWHQAGGVTLGAGLRCFLAGDDVLPMSELTRLVIDKAD